MEKISDLILALIVAERAEQDARRLFVGFSETAPRIAAYVERTQAAKDALDAALDVSPRTVA